MALKWCAVTGSDKDGKTQVYTLNREPLVKLREGWLAAFGYMQTASLKALRRAAER
ncbi:MAG: hypothetical protein HC788_10695 [Sphingopyxis sp.]|nr:hypothetical protein [Sphingopyxis sp.]